MMKRRLYDDEPVERMSFKNKKSVKSMKLKRRNTVKSLTLKKKIYLTDHDFFSGISLNYELGKDFLREMDTPICTSNIIFLPTTLISVPPGRCLILSPYGHSSALGFHCDECKGISIKPSALTFNSQTQETLKETDEIFSQSLCFFNNVEKVLQNKSFYLSLLGHSMSTVRQSFKQPGLLYSYMILNKFCPKPFPIFTDDGCKLTMFITFCTSKLHIGETCLRIFSDNLQNYTITLDCFKGHYIIKFTLINHEENIVNVNVDKICEAVSQLDFSDELKQEFVNGTTLINDFTN